MRDLQLVALEPRPHVICRPQPDQLRAEQRGSGIAIAAAMLDDVTHAAFLPSERGSMIPAPRCGARNPPSHVRAVALVLLGELLAERRLLVAEHEQKEGRPHDRSVFEHR